MQKSKGALKAAIALESGFVLAAMPITLSIGLVSFSILTTWAVLKHFEHRRFVNMT